MQLTTLGKIIGTAVLLTGLAACSTTVPIQSDDNSADHFNDCKTAALDKSQDADNGKSAALYHAAGRNLSFCVENAGHETDVSELLSLQALAAVNYFKAGDIETARSVFQTYRDMAETTDLYFSDGTSVHDNLSMLLGYESEGASRVGSLTNAKDALKSEYRRIEYWQNH